MHAIRGRRLVASVAGAALLTACTATNGSAPASETTVATAPAASAAAPAPTTSGHDGPAAAALQVRTLPEELVSPGVAASQSHAQLAEILDGVDAVALGAVRSEAAARLADDRRSDGPIIVGEVDLGPGTQGAGATVQANLVMALPTAPARLVMRSLAVTEAVPTSADVAVRVTVDGVEQDVALQPVRDRVVVRIGADQRAAARTDGGGLTLVIDWRAPVPDAGTLVPGQGPGSYRLYGSTPDVVALGHWLPVPVAMPGNDGAVPPWGDLGAFAPATWVLEIRAPGGTVRTGGVDWPLPAADGSTRQVALGWGLRDLAAVWLRQEDPMHPDAVPVAASDAGDDAVVVATSGTSVTDWVEVTSANQLALFDSLYGPTPWREHDVVRVDLDGALGMEFPGLVMVDSSAWADTDLGRFVLAHEWGHQWFHALVGNGSLSDPAVDEPLAQYMTWRWLVEEFSPVRAQAMAGQFIPSWSDTPERTDQAAGAFADASDYRTEIYQRGPTGWIRAAQELGVDAVDDVLRSLVADRGLGRGVATDELLDAVEATDPRVASILVETWAGQ